MNVLEFEGYGPGMPRVYLPAQNIISFRQIDFNGDYGTEIMLPEGRYIRVSASPEQVKSELERTAHDPKPSRVLPYLDYGPNEV